MLQRGSSLCTAPPRQADPRKEPQVPGKPTEHTSPSAEITDTFPHTHTGDPDTRGTPEGIGADNVANSHDFIMSLVMANVYFKVPGVIVS